MVLSPCAVGRTDSLALGWAGVSAVAIRASQSPDHSDLLRDGHLTQLEPMRHNGERETLHSIPLG